MEARFKLQQQIDYLFRDAPMSRAMYELKEELLANSYEKYLDLIAEGMEEQQAMHTVLAGIGNVDELVRALPEGQEEARDPVWENERRQKSAKTMAVAVGMYVLAGVVFFAGGWMGGENGEMLGLVLAAALCIAPTSMVVYNSYRWPAYRKKNDTVVEDFKEFHSREQRKKGLRGAVSMVIWTVALALYCALSFATMAWHITWITFLIAACCEAVVTLVFRLKELK